MADQRRREAGQLLCNGTQTVKRRQCPQGSWTGRPANGVRLYQRFFVAPAPGLGHKRTSRNDP
jgi:hypothetical protein